MNILRIPILVSLALVVPRLADARTQIADLEFVRKMEEQVEIDHVAIDLSQSRLHQTAGAPRRNSYLRDLEFSAHGRDFVVQLTRSPVIAPDCVATIVSPDGENSFPCPANAYAGTLRGEPTSMVTAVFDDQGVTAQILSTTGAYSVKPLSVGVEASEAQYGMEHIHEVQMLPLGLDSTGPDMTSTTGIESIERAAMISGRLAIAPITMISDTSASLQSGGGQSSVRDMVNIAIGASFLLASQVNVRFQVTQVRVWVQDPNEFSTTNSIDTRATQVRAWKRNHLSGAPFVYQVTGQPTGGGLGGSFAEQFCRTDGAAVGKRHGGALFRTNWSLLAHEFGHSAGQCAHDGQEDCTIAFHEHECTAQPSSTFIMQKNPSALTPPTEFSSCSIDEITEYLTSSSDGKSCTTRAVCGDYVASDGKTALTILDVLAALQMAAGYERTPPHPISDVAAPFGAITATDALVLINAVVGKIPIPVRCGP